MLVPGKSTTDAVFALRLSIEKYRGRSEGDTFVDLEKAYKCRGRNCGEMSLREED